MGAKGSKGTPSPPNLHGLFGMQNSFCPEVAGVGLVCIQTEKGLEVKSVLEGTVAHKCGLIEPGDMLKQVDGISVEKWTLKDVSNLVLGQPGQEVCLKFKRKTKNQKTKYIVKLRRSAKASLEPRMVVTDEEGCHVVRHEYLEAYTDPSSPQPAQHLSRLPASSASSSSATPSTATRTIALNLLPPPAPPPLESDASTPGTESPPAERSTLSTPFQSPASTLFTISGVEECSGESAFSSREHSSLSSCRMSPDMTPDSEPAIV
mmetsp:Transcript_4056/g.9767  ORF Transcript_4056/g.9767 Transcript_4056/m.9767 type:complete len:263 (+) Transcript_4056:256-1044(+)